MIIKNIELNNFGSYEGISSFDFNADNGKNIILIGGKNGAGKTTLFTAIRLCIYGYRAFGYQSINSFYNRAIIKLINNNAKLQEPTSSYIKINMLINNGQSYDEYEIVRVWTYEQTSLREDIKIVKNGKGLNEDEVNDFEQYIIQIIPPDLFDLYFFDGEKIADFFLEDGSKVRLKNAFLTLCGYDIFEIMNKNFKRMLSSSTLNNDTVNKYIELKDKINNSATEIEELKDRIFLNYKNIDEVDAKIKTLDINYKKKGGVSKKEWDQKFQEIKDEEKRREELNSNLKQIANDTLPFLILKTEIDNLLEQINKEENLYKIRSFSESLKINFIKQIFEKEFTKDSLTDKKIKSIEKQITDFCKKNNILLDLSNEQIGIILYQINKIKQFDVDNIYKISDSIKKSIKRSQLIREEIDKCNVDKVDDYVLTKSQLLDEKTNLLNLSIKLSNEIQEKESNYLILNNDFNKAKKEYESELKKNSINDISSKAVLMLDRLLSELYKEQIDQIIKRFKVEINKLMRKKDFINDIEIDSDFNITVYRTNKYTLKELKEIKNNLGEQGILNALGKRALDTINKLSFNDLKKKVGIDIELNKSSFSNGEKQIFIMALYKSLMSLCRHEVPFVIDTPFARIDSEHRNNISKYFFRELKGQVFILSTNEEVEGKQFDMIEDKLAATYMLENTDNTKTTIVKDSYFTEV